MLVDDRAEKALSLFLDAIELSSDFELVDCKFDDENGDVIVLRDLSKQEGTLGVYVEVPVSEIINKAVDVPGVDGIMRVVRAERNSIVLDKVTRIVGYYSRVNNWNKSKIGELRDRVNGNYGLTNSKQKYTSDRIRAIDNL